MNSRPLEKEEIRKFSRQLLMAIRYSHENRILHRDLKPQNLLIDSNGDLKIADFGLARSFTYPMQPLTHEVVTLWYRAPEILLGQEIYTSAIDMWAVGCIIGRHRMSSNSSRNVPQGAPVQRAIGHRTDFQDLPSVGPP